MRAGIVSAIEALTPTTATRGEPTFTHVAGELPEESATDRRFVVRLTAPPTQVGEVLNGTDWRWLTSCEVAVNYVRGRLVEEDEDRIAEDAQQIQQTLLAKGNHHANFEGIVPSGDGYATTDLEDSDERNYLLHVGLTIHHL